MLRIRRTTRLLFIGRICASDTAFNKAQVAMSRSMTQRRLQRKRSRRGATPRAAMDRPRPSRPSTMVLPCARRSSSIGTSQIRTSSFFAMMMAKRLRRPLARTHNRPILFEFRGSGDPRNGQILGADMELNESNFRLVADAGGSSESGSIATYPLLPVLMHEAGHFLGLGHSTDTASLMYALYRPSPTASLTDDDSQGLCSIDLVGGLRSISSGGLFDAGNLCDPTPTNGFQSECGDASGGGPSTSEAGTDASTEIGYDSGETTVGIRAYGGCSVSNSNASSSSNTTYMGHSLALGVVISCLWRRRRDRQRFRVHS